MDSRSVLALSLSRAFQGIRRPDANDLAIEEHLFELDFLLGDADETLPVLGVDSEKFIENAESIMFLRTDSFHYYTPGYLLSDWTCTELTDIPFFFEETLRQRYRKPFVELRMPVWSLPQLKWIERWLAESVRPSGIDLSKAEKIVRELRIAKLKSNKLDE